MTVVNPTRFYRNGATMLIQTPVGRSNQRGLPPNESWEACSSVFNDPGGSYGTFDDQYVDTYTAPDGTDTTAMRSVQPIWETSSGDSTADLQTKIHAALNGAGYRTLKGAIIT